MFTEHFLIIHLFTMDSRLQQLCSGRSLNMYTVCCLINCFVGSLKGVCFIKRKVVSAAFCMHNKLDKIKISYFGSIYIYISWVDSQLELRTSQLNGKVWELTYTLIIYYYIIYYNLVLNTAFTQLTTNLRLNSRRAYVKRSPLYLTVL